MFQIDHVEQWKGQPVVDVNGDKVGKLDDVLIDLRTNEPTLGSVSIGRLSKRHVLVPLVGAVLSRDQIRLPHDRAIVEGGPELGSDGVRRQDEVVLGQHYGLAVPEDDGTDGPLYRTGTQLAEERVAADEARAKAEALEAEAEQKLATVVEGQTEAAKATEQADAADADRKRLLAEAEALRAQAGDLPPS